MLNRQKIIYLSMENIDNYVKDIIKKNNPNSEYIFILDEQTIWLVDYRLGVAFPTPIEYTSQQNGLYESGLSYKQFPDYLDFQNYLEEITGGQEVSLEITVHIDTDIQKNSNSRDSRGAINGSSSDRGIIKWVPGKGYV
jgi:hypothetical protein